MKCGPQKFLCECSRPVDRSLPTRDLQCRVCFERNRFALAMHERTRKWLGETEWWQHQAEKATGPENFALHQIIKEKAKQTAA